MANSCPLKVECIDDNVDRIQCIDDPTNQVHVSTYDFIYISDTIKWLEYGLADWESIGSEYRLIIPRSVHKYTNPMVESMVISKPTLEAKYAPSQPTWEVLANDSIVITSYDPVNCKIAIKGEQ